MAPHRATPLDPAIRDLMVDFYAKDIERTEALVGISPRGRETHE
jgi:hypothetical protein